MNGADVVAGLQKMGGKGIPRTQRRALTQPLSEFAQKYDRNEAIALAYLSGQHSMAAIAEHFGVHYTTVSRLLKVHEAKK